MEEKKTKRKRRRTRRVKITDRGRGRPKGTLRRFPFDETRSEMKKSLIAQLDEEEFTQLLNDYKLEA